MTIQTIRFLPDVRSFARVLWHAALAAAGVALASSPGTASATEVDPDILTAPLTFVGSEGELCPPGSELVALSADGAAATVTLSQGRKGLGSAHCTLTFEAEVPEGFVMGMPIAVLRGVAIGGVVLARRYAFAGASKPGLFFDRPGDRFILEDRSSEVLSPSCDGTQRVRFSIDVTAVLFEAESFFQLDSLDLDTAFRAGTDYRFCDPNESLDVPPGQVGEFCDGLQQRPCAEGLTCEHKPNASVGACVAP